MAVRPIYRVLNYKDSNEFVEEILMNFQWYSGFSKSQKQKSIEALHESILLRYGDVKILEISSKSMNPLGVKLSAFNLEITHKNTGQKYSVESAFQSSKVFEAGGPFIDLRFKDSIDAKRDIRLKKSGKLLSFEFYKTQWKLEPKTAFYDWLYINALNQNTELAEELIKYEIFTDIEFNHNKSINCQARSAALYVSLKQSDLLVDALSSIDNYLNVINKVNNKSPNNSTQLNFFD